MKRFRVSEYISPKEAEAIIGACPKLRDKFILRVMWETGGRISEVLSLKPEYLDPVNNCIFLPNLKQKSRKEGQPPPLKRIFMFPDSILIKDLQEYISTYEIVRGDWVFQGGVRKEGKVGQVSPVYIWYLLSNVRHPSDRWKRKDGLATELGIRKIKEDKLKSAWPHLWRHGAAMHIYHKTQRLDVTQRQLGHSSIQTTEGYAELTNGDRKKIIDETPKNT